MEDKFHLYQSELRSKNIQRYKVIGMVTDILLSKDIFPRNEDIPTFLNNVFGIAYKDYVLKSRTTILARCVRDLYAVEDKEFEQYRKQLFEYVKSDIEVKPNSQRNKDSFHKWMDGINE
jgi:hypothetical protein